MTPKEKATELINKFRDTDIWRSTAKKCAIIAVDEIINAIDWHKFETPNKEFEFWNEVKQEIEKL